MTNLAIELLVLTVFLVNFGAILTANIHSKSVEDFNEIDFFSVNIQEIHIVI